MTGATARLVGSVVVSALSLFAAAVSRRPELAVVAAPFLVVAGVALVALRPPRLEVAVSLSEDRLVEGEPLVLTVTVVSTSGPARARVRLDLPAGLVALDERTHTEMLVGVTPTTTEWDLVAVSWGAIDPVTAEVSATDRLGAFGATARATTTALRVLPLESTLRGLLSPRSLRTIFGAHLSRQRGDGVEYVDSRPFVPGDRARAINWRVSARRQELWVDQRRPERSGEVVLFIDSFLSVGEPLDNTLRRSVELAGALADRHVSVNDRIGLVDLGGVMRWVRPGGGTTHLYRVVEALIETEAHVSVAHKTIDVLPARAIPARSLVIVLSPLADRRGVEVVRELRARGTDVAVIEVTPSLVVSPQDRRRHLAHRLWVAEVHHTRVDLRSRGIAVAPWRDGDPVEPVLDALRVFRDGVLRAAR